MWDATRVWNKPQTEWNPAQRSRPPPAALTLSVAEGTAGGGTLIVDAMVPTPPAPADGTRVHLVLYGAPQPGGDCPPLLGGSCFGSAGPQYYLGSAISSDGIASFAVPVPTTHPSQIGVQAIVLRGAQPAVLSELVLVDIDTNECALDLDTCIENAVCTNTIGSYTCDCVDGYSGDGTSCEDIDECDPGNPVPACDANEACTNLPGSYACSCVPGFEDVDGVCTNIDDCAQAPCLNASICVDGIEAYTCACAGDFDGDHCENYTGVPTAVSNLILSDGGRVGVHFDPPADNTWADVVVVRSESGPGDLTKPGPHRLGRTHRRSVGRHRHNPVSPTTTRSSHGPRTASSRRP